MTHFGGCVYGLDMAGTGWNWLELAGLCTPQLYSQRYSLKGFVVDLVRLAKTEGLDLTQVDESVFTVGKDTPFPMSTVELGPGVVLHYLHPARAIPYLFYHPALHEHMWRTPEARWQAWTKPPQAGDAGPEQQRVYSHPFTCDMALEALRRMPAGIRHVLIMLLLFKVTQFRDLGSMEAMKCTTHGCMERCICQLEGGKCISATRCLN